MSDSYDKRWRHFERLVAAIHKAESQGGKVTWNDTIAGRQFDVTIRFDHAFYKFLTVIECKDQAKPLPIGDVDAFVTKARDCKADKPVMVSASGYQEGCYEVARRHGVELFTLREVEDAPDGWLSDRITPALNVYDIELEPANGARLPLRDEGGSLTYYTHHTMVLVDGDSFTLWDFIHSILRDANLKLGATPLEFEGEFPPGTRVRLPHNDGEFAGSMLRFTAAIVEARVLREPWDPAVIPKTYAMRDELTGTEKRVTPHALGLGHETVLTPGKFYVIPDKHFYYYCRSIVDGHATFVFLESYQHGMLFQATMVQEVKYAFYYVEVTDESHLKRLRYLLERFDRPRGPKQTPPR